MSKQSGLSSILAVAASYLAIGVVALSIASPARAASEEDIARPQGSFVSTSVAPVSLGALGNAPRVAVILASEEDAAVPQGAFTSAMTAPQNNVRLADNSNRATLD